MEKSYSAPIWMMRWTAFSQRLRSAIRVEDVNNERKHPCKKFT
jgi:hypothetical protein